MNNKFIININKIAVLQYIMIYLAAHMTGSFFYNTNMMHVKELAIVISVILIIFRYIKLNNELLFVLIGITTGMIFSRILNSNIGIGSITDYVAPILFMYCASKIDEEKFCTRFIKFATLFAFMSIVFWLLATIAFPVFKNILSFISIKYQYSVGMEVYDSFFYALMPDNWTGNPRNDGIYSEPAQFSILLNSAVWILLFAEDKVALSPKQIRKSFLILFITLATSQSTTGYICLGFMLLGFMLTKKGYMSKTIYKVAFVGLAIIFADYVIRGQESLLYSGLFGKVIDTNGVISLEAEDSTGKYRIAAITKTWDLFLRRPWGWGVDYVSRYVDRYSMFGEGSAGGGFTNELARYGFLPIGIFVGWIFYRVYKNRMQLIPAISYLFFYFWTVFAQAAITYPLIFVPLFIGSFADSITGNEVLSKANINKEEGLT